MYIDFHTHAFHPKIAAKAVEHLNSHYGITCQCTGVMDDLIRRVKKAGLDKMVVLCAATSAAQVIPANNFALSLKAAHPDAIPFGTIHPDFDDWENQLARLKARGIKGLKLHPDFQGFRLDEKRLLPIIEAAQKDFVILFHVGDKLAPEDNPSCPYKLSALLDQFPNARFVAAHFGGYHQWEHALKVLIGKNIYIDTSSTLDFIDDTTLNAIMKKHPHEKILFGSDYPLYSPDKELIKLKKRLKLSNSKLETFLSNGAELLGLM